MTYFLSINALTVHCNITMFLDKILLRALSDFVLHFPPPANVRVIFRSCVVHKVLHFQSPLASCHWSMDVSLMTVLFRAETKAVAVGKIQQERWLLLLQAQS